MSKYVPFKMNDLHVDTFNTVVRATDDVLIKLEKAQQRHGLTRGWRFPPEGKDPGDGRFFNTAEECAVALREHLKKGDITDCIAYLMFLKELEDSNISQSLIDQFT